MNRLASAGRRAPDLQPKEHTKQNQDTRSNRCQGPILPTSTMTYFLSEWRRRQPPQVHRQVPGPFDSDGQDPSLGHLSMISSSFAGISEFNRTGSTGTSCRMASICAANVSPRNGSLRLLWRHVGHCSSDASTGLVLVNSRNRCGFGRLRWLSGPLDKIYFGQAEVQYLGVSSLGSEDVCWLDVAVDDALLVRLPGRWLPGSQCPVRQDLSVGSLLRRDVHAASYHAITAWQ